MSFKKTRKSVEDLVQKELAYAQEDHGMAFYSAHKGAAVIFEEICETTTEYELMTGKWVDFWQSVMVDDDRDIINMRASCIGRHAILLACEAIQVAAMCAKMMKEDEDAAEVQDGE